MTEVVRNTDSSFYLEAEDGGPRWWFTETGERTLSSGSHDYPTRAEAEAAKARFEFRQEHPNMPEEWHERNCPGAKREFTPPDNVMFRGKRLGLQSIEDDFGSGNPIYQYGLDDEAFAVVSSGHWAVNGGRDYIMGEDWSISGRTSLADGFARLQAWLEQDAREWETKQKRKTRGAKAEMMLIDEVSEWQRETLKLIKELPGKWVEAEELCADCNKPCDGIYRRRLKSGICSNCQESDDAYHAGVAREAMSFGEERKRMVYDEPPYQPPRMNAAAKWHVKNTSAGDEKPGWA